MTDVLKSEIEQLRERLGEAEELLDAIRDGRVDALVVHGPEGDRVYTLKGADQTYRTMIETMQEGAVMLSPDGLILYANRRFAEMLDASIENVIGGSMDDLVAVEDKDRFAGLYTRAFGGEGIKAEISLRSRDDMVIPVLVSMQRYRDEDLVTVCMVVTDLTALKKTEEQLKRYAETLHRKNAELHQRAEQLGRLSSELTMAEHRERRRIAKILHDHLQQLLVSAMFKLETLEGVIDGNSWQRVRNAVQVMEAALEISRTLTIELSPHVLYEGGLVPALEWLVRWMKEKHGLSVTLAEEKSVAPEREDIKILLFDSVRELLLNVVKHAEVASARIDITRLNGNCSITVSDPGKGFDPTEGKTGRPESGFGLFSIRERLLTLGGRCEINSAPGKGTSVNLIAPMRAIAPADAEMETEETEAGAMAAGHADTAALREPATITRVMLVDDHSVMRQGLSVLLSGYPDIEVVGEAQDGEDAVQLARKVNPDVILMDISMPRMNGIEATRIIHSELPNIRIIGLSMFDAADQAAAILQAGATKYLKKSGNKRELVNAIQTAVNAGG